MRPDLRMNLDCLRILLLGLGLSSSSLWAQEAADPDAAGSDPSAVETEASEEAPELTEIERVMRLERDLEADKKRLEEIKADLAAREDLVDELSEDIKEAQVDLAAKKEQLAEMGGADASAEAAALAGEIQSLEELIQVATTQSDITFQSARTLQGQIQALEQKIANMERAYQESVGPSVKEMETKPEPEAASPPPQPSEAPGLTPTQILLPGTGTSPGTEPETPAVAQPETAEQLEARREAEKAEEAARQAAAAVVNFVERKAALENQIEMEEQLLQTARKSRDNLDQALDSVQAELERLIAEDASTDQLQRARNNIEGVEDLQRANREEIDQRRDYLDSLRERLENLHEEQILIQQEAEARRLDAAEARKKSIWLESPLHPTNLWRWASTRGPRMLLVVVVAWILLALVRWSARRVARTVVRSPGKERSRGANRADTLALSFRSALSLFIMVAAVLLVFQEAGVDIKTVLGGAAILGVALAFGAQNLMRDYFTGFMILLEDQYELGDLITVGAITGRVERVNMRTTMLRDIEGRVHFIPNGEIKSVTNRTYVWGRAVLELPIAFSEDVDRVMEVILDEARAFREDEEKGEWVTDEPVMLGVDKFTEYGVVIKFMVQTLPDKIFPTRRELLRRIKKRFDSEGIKISVPHRLLVQETGDDVQP